MESPAPSGTASLHLLHIQLYGRRILVYANYGNDPQVKSRSAQCVWGVIDVVGHPEYGCLIPVPRSH